VFAQRGPRGPKGEAFRGRGHAPKMENKAPDFKGKMHMEQQRHRYRGQNAVRGHQCRFGKGKCDMRGQGQRQRGMAFRGSMRASGGRMRGMMYRRGSLGEVREGFRGRGMGRGMGRGFRGGR